jgi:hypothetical protein
MGDQFLICTACKDPQNRSQNVSSGHLRWQAWNAATNPSEVVESWSHPWVEPVEQGASAMDLQVLMPL